MDARPLIGSSRFPIFRSVSCPSLVCVVLCFGMRGKTSGCSLPPHHIMETRSLALKRTFALSFIISLSPRTRLHVGRFECYKSFGAFFWLPSGATDGHPIVC